MDPSKPIPSINALVAQFGASKGTVEKALLRLIDEGLVKAEHGRGYFPVPLFDRYGTVDLAIGPTTSILDSANYLGKIFSGITAECAAIGRDVRIFSSLFHGGASDTAKKFFRNFNATPNKFGILVLDLRDDSFLLELRKLDVPVVVLDYDASLLGMDCIATESREDCFRMTKIMLKKGHNKIGLIIGGPKRQDGSFYDPDNEHRKDGYRQALEDAGIAFDPSFVFEREGNSIQSIQEKVAAQCLESPFTSLISDSYELGYIQDFIKEKKPVLDYGIFCPGIFKTELQIQKSVIFSYDFHAMGRRSVQILLDRVKNGPGKALREYLSPSISGADIE